MFNLAIEGNIGAGKSTFLEYLSQKFPGRIRSFAEPVQKWRNVNNTNLLGLMYQDPKRYGFIFQSYVQLTMLQMHDEISQVQAEQVKNFNKQFEKWTSAPNDEQSTVNRDRTLKDLTNQDEKRELNEKKRKTSPNDELSNQKKVMKTNQTNVDATDCGSEKPTKEVNESKSQQTYSINIMERSIFSARYIFVENLFQNNLLSDIEYKILDESFLFLIKKQEIKLDLIIYLRSTPLECYKRMVQRSRPEETQTLQLEHFEKFHRLHEEFLMGENSRMRKLLSVPVLVIDTVDTKEKMFEKIDRHSKLIMNELTSREGLTEIVCGRDSN